MVYSNPDVIERICDNAGEEDNVTDSYFSAIADNNNDASVIADNNNDGDGSSDVRRFFENTSVFITGGSGFLGMTLIEKLLRSCPGIKRLFLLMRSRKGKTAEERATDMFLNPLFFPLLENSPRILQKVKIIQGDIEQPNLGISTSDMIVLEEEVEIVYHVAATVNFDEALRKAYQINVTSTKTLLTMAESMARLKAFVHVSTLFCHVHCRKRIEEKFYLSHCTEEDIEALLNLADDYTIAVLSKRLLDKVPNTYALTKAIAENVIMRKKDKLPIAVYRPGIVMNTHTEPIRGWNLSVQGAGALILGTGLGILRVLRVNGNKTADIIPVDKCANILATLPWYIHKSRQENNKEVKIYNHVSNKETWQNLTEHVLGFIESKKASSKFQIWAVHSDFETNRLRFNIKFFLYHVLPLPFFVLAEKLQKQRPRLRKVYIKIAHLIDELSFFTQEDFKFEDGSIQKLWSCMSKLDQQQFHFDVSNWDWKDYTRCLGQGYAHYVMGESMEKVKLNWKKHQRLLWLDRMILYPIKGLLLFIAYKLGISIISLFKSYLDHQINRIYEL